MIRVDRGPEPPALAQARWWRLARAILAHRAGLKVTFEVSKGKRADHYLADGYDVAADVLDERSGHICAYCEWPQTNVIVEHFRPKESAKDEHNDVDDSYYWWLAWSWENHLFSCSACNGKKGTYFPVDGPRLAYLDENIEHEQAKLIDPCREWPMSLIEYVRIDDHEWMPIGLDHRGQYTVELFELYINNSLADHYRNHVRDLLRNEISRLRAASAAQLAAQWEEDVLRRWIYNPQAAFRALTWSVLNHHFPEAWRAQRGLALPRPDELVSTPPLAPQIRSDLEQRLSEDVCLAVRAVGSSKARGSKFVGPDALVEDGTYFEEALARVLKELGPQEIAELSAIFNGPFVCSKKAILKALRGLAAKGLVVKHDGQVWGWRGD